MLHFEFENELKFYNLGAWPDAIVFYDTGTIDSFNNQKRVCKSIITFYTYFLKTCSHQIVGNNMP